MKTVILLGVVVFIVHRVWLIYTNTMPGLKDVQKKEENHE